MSSWQGQQKQRQFQVFHQHERRAAWLPHFSRGEFASNEIQTAKYNFITFVPLNLFEQFQRSSNLYFLVIAVLQFLPLSPMTPTSWIPLAFVLALNMVKEAVEDIHRKKMDKEVNGRTVKAIDPATTDESRTRWVKWSEVQVGMVLILREDEQLPADILILATSDFHGGQCFIETANLDGETNLKSKESIELTHKALRHQQPVVTEIAEDHVTYLQQMEVCCETPNENLNAFYGAIAHRHWDTAVALTNKQVIYRGCTLRNIRWIYGLVVFTGEQTKLVMNASEKKFKRTTLDKLTNQYLVGIFVLLGLLCIISGVLGGIETENPVNDRMWYLNNGLEKSWAIAFFLNILVFLILLSALIPIALTVTMELIRIVHKFYIDEDLMMCYENPKTGAIIPARARTSNLAEDLGRIQYIFSDKTGTLTQNSMEFMKFVVAGRPFGTGTTEIGRAMYTRNGLLPPPDLRPLGLVLEQGNNFYDPDVSLGAWAHSLLKEDLERFFLALAVCHTVMAKLHSGDSADPTAWRRDNVVYQASSPDEEALVIGAKGAGFWFRGRQMAQVFVDVEGEPEPRVFELLNVCEFNSTRKRMSVVVRTPDGRLLLICKGADSVIFERLSRYSPYVNETREALQAYANEGLRTLVLAQREITPTEYEAWAKDFQAAFTSLENRDEKLDQVAEIIERDMDLVGATAIEDKLQDGVPECVAKLARANIQIWVLTGDKVETAINVAMACDLINTAYEVHTVVLPDFPRIPNEEARREERIAQEHAAREQEVLNQLTLALKHCQPAGQPHALVIDGYSLEYALRAEEASERPGAFLQFADLCRAVVCCRVSPKQKADVVQLVRQKLGVITLAVGDGANDVGMITKAHIGVGISGNEGAQAVMASDYALGQFRFLLPLLFIHGRWDFQRIAIMICYFYYKNVSFSIVVFFYGFWTKFSGATIWDDYFNSAWNVLFTQLPIMAVCIFDKDFRFQETLLEQPELYKEVQSGQDFSAKKFFAWNVDSMYMCAVVYFLPMYMMMNITRFDGQDDGKWVMSYTMMAACHLACNFRLALVIRTWNLAVASLFVLSVFFYWIFAALYCIFPPDFSGGMYYVNQQVFSVPHFWLDVFVTTVVSLIPAAILLFYDAAFRPSASQRALTDETAPSRKITEGEGLQDPDVGLQCAPAPMSLPDLSPKAPLRALLPLPDPTGGQLPGMVASPERPPGPSTGPGPADQEGRLAITMTLNTTNH